MKLKSLKSGRRDFFRGCAAVFGLNVLADKLPPAYFEDNFLSFLDPEGWSLLNKAEGHEFDISPENPCSENTDHWNDPTPRQDTQTTYRRHRVEVPEGATCIERGEYFCIRYDRVKCVHGYRFWEGRH